MKNPEVRMKPGVEMKKDGKARNRKFISAAALTAVAMAGPIVAKAAGQSGSGKIKVNEHSVGYLDRSGMPLCVSDKSSGYFVRFVWNDDPYEREVFVEPHPASEIELCTSGKRVFLKEGLKDLEAKQKEWKARKVRFPLPAAAGSFRLSDQNGKSLVDFDISDELRELLAQVREGASEARDRSKDDDLVSDLGSRNAGSFDRALNQSLTKSYGARIAIRAYHQALMSRPANQELNSFVLASLSDTVEANQAFNESLKEYTAVFIEGFGHTLGGNNRYEPFISGLRAMGLDTRVLFTKPYGRTPELSAEIRFQLDELLNQGRKLLVFSASNGSLQTLAAITDLSDKLAGHGAPQGYGSISAFVSLSGVFGGSFAASWATKYPQWYFFKKGLSGSMAQEGIYLEPWDDLESFKDLSLDFVEHFMKDRVSKIPQNVVYVGLIGTPDGSGLVKDPAIGSLQREVIRPYLHGYGANDGYIEFPGTEFPQSWAPHVYQIPVDASHAIMDGHFQQFELSDREKRQSLISGLVKFTVKKARELGR